MWSLGVAFLVIELVTYCSCSSSSLLCFLRILNGNTNLNGGVPISFKQTFVCVDWDDKPKIFFLYKGILNDGATILSTSTITLFFDSEASILIVFILDWLSRTP